ncbi:MAG: isoprenylcysteine carboxylmethyltransferase family protein [Treponema sp.]|nr:isoprenylcysteine carboxylmethyltransferase family protein [Treponema sp.]
MTKKLLLRALVKYLAGIVVAGALIFIPAGSLKFFNGWLFMGLLFVPMLIAGVILMFKNPELLEKRLNAKEKQNDQGLVIMLSGLMFLAGFIVSGLGFRFHWYQLPLWGVIAASVIFVLAYIMYAEVLRENTFLSRTIEVQENQTVVDTGLYGIVRHPMYTSTLLLFMTMPLILGSVFGFIIFLAYPFIIAKRIKGEEAFLEQELNGYSEYKQKVKYRLIPFVW